jgi:hypothetical protein
MTISSFCHDVLRERGPLTLDVLARLALDEGVTTSRTPEAAVRNAIGHNAVELADGRWASPLALLESRSLTTRLLVTSWYDEQPASHDLAPLHLAVRASPLPLATGGVLQRARYGYGWNWPDSWPGLHCREGQLFVLRLRDGVLHVDVIDETPALRARGHALALTVGSLDEQARYRVSGSTAVSENLQRRLWQLVAADPEFLTAPAPPLSECIPQLAAALKTEWEAYDEETRHWRPTLDLSRELQDIALDAARDADLLLDEWLNHFVARSLRARDTGTLWQPLYDESIRPLRRRL